MNKQDKIVLNRTELQALIDKMGGEFGNQFVMVNDDGDIEYFYTTKLERYTQKSMNTKSKKEDL